MFDSFSMDKDFMKLKHQKNSTWKTEMKLMSSSNKSEEVIEPHEIKK